MRRSEEGVGVSVSRAIPKIRSPNALIIERLAFIVHLPATVTDPRLQTVGLGKLEYLLLPCSTQRYLYMQRRIGPTSNQMARAAFLRTTRRAIASIIEPVPRSRPQSSPRVVNSRQLSSIPVIWQI